MKIGGITIHWARNYGAMLQAYALQTAMERLGHEYTIIDYQTKLQERTAGIYPPIGSKSWTWRMMRNTLKRVRNAPIQKRLDSRLALFDAFKKEHLNLTPRRYYSYSELEGQCPDFDAYVCGSDQIWRMRDGEHLEYSPAYHLQFAPNGKPRIAYAPSFGVSSIPDHFRDECRDRLLKIDHLSVRELDGKQLIKNLTTRDVPVVLDPTFLISRDHWEAILSPPDITGSYILVYYMGGNPEALHHVTAQLQKRTGIEHIVVLQAKTMTKNRLFTHYPDAGPLEFLGWFKNAAYVCTSSFHGMAFSILFEKTFFALMPGEISSRLVSLSETLALNHRFVSNESPCIADMPTTMDYEQVNHRLKAERIKSMAYIMEALRIPQ